MIRLYTPIFLLQMFCLYHAYQNKPHQMWYFVILFFPLVGSLLYLYQHFYSQKNVDLVLDNLQSVVKKNHRIEQLEKELKFADTIHNRSLLADEYSKIGEYEEAIDLYSSCLKKGYENDDDLLIKLTVHSYYLEDYESAVNYGTRVKEQVFLENREEVIAYAWSLYYQEEYEQAEKVFQKTDRPFCNYKQRLQYANFLMEQGRADEGDALAQIMLEEIDSMNRAEKRSRKLVRSEIQRFLAG